jgi:DNA-binding transcriptional ArsR family regulator
VDAKAKLQEIETIFEALAHASRRQILLTVWFRGGVVTSSEIAQRFHHAWPTISRHLRVLEAAGLITHEKDGRNRYFRVNKEKLQVARDWFKWFDKTSDVQKKERERNESEGNRKQSSRKNEIGLPGPSRDQ